MAENHAQTPAGAVRRQLVELQDQARRDMISSSASSLNEARYHAGRVDALRDALAIIPEASQ